MTLELIILIWAVGMVACFVFGLWTQADQYCRITVLDIGMCLIFTSMSWVGVAILLVVRYGNRVVSRSK
jgi:uncharacterized membrane protein